MDHEEVGAPIPFPQPVIRRGVMRKCNVTITDRNGQTRIEERVVLHTESNGFYELGRILKEAIYGQVNHAIVLVIRPDGMYYRASPVVQCAIKVYGKQRLISMANTTQEHPLAELSTMQFIGHHPNVMSPVECCMDSDYIYLIMEFCDGGELYDIVEENQVLTEPITRHYMKNILLGLQHLHSIGIAHRDMSLENVLYSRSTGICKIIDFGMSLRLPVSQTNPNLIIKIRPHGACGKKNYIGPEVLANRENFNPMFSDIWAVGVMMFIMLTGCPPVEIANASDPRYKMVVRGNIANMLQQWGINVSVEAIDLISHILREAPEERYTIQQILAHPWMNM